MSIPTNPHAVIEINGTRFDSYEQGHLFQEVSVELVTNESSEAVWRAFDPDFKLIDRFATAQGVPQAVVRVWLNYGQDMGEPIFKGLLARIERGAESTTLRCYDMGYKMRLLQRAGYRNRKDDLAILRDLAERNGLLFEGPGAPLNLEPHAALTQDEQTDWQHALERARDAGLVLFVRGDTLFAKQPAHVGTPKRTLTYRKDFYMTRDFDFLYRTPENLEGRPRRITVRGRGKNGRRLTGESDDSARGTERVQLKRDVPGRHTRQKLTRRAQAQKELEREHSFECHVTALFPLNESERLDARDTVKLGSVGALFSGAYICDSVRYRFAPGKFETALDLYRDINQ